MRYSAHLHPVTSVTYAHIRDAVHLVLGMDAYADPDSLASSLANYSAFFRLGYEVVKRTNGEVILQCPYGRLLTYTPVN